MKRLWAPWRTRYICGRKKGGCIFCGNKASTRDDRKRHIISRSRHSFAMLNLYPYNNGHVMVAPYRHVRGFDGLSGEELLDLMKLLVRTKKVLDRTMKPHGYNIGANLGRVAGAGLGHLHLHIVPRWHGDTNFMPAISSAKVISQSLDELYELLKRGEKGA